MLKNINKIRRSLSKGKDKEKEESKKKKKSNQKKINQASQTSFDEQNSKHNVIKKLDFKELANNKEEIKMDDESKSSNLLSVDQIPFIESDIEEDDSKSNIFKDEQLPNTVKILKTNNGSKVYLIGTAHFSEKSCEDVRNVITSVKPDFLVLEICEERIKTLVLDEKILREKIENFTFADAKHIIKEYGPIQGIIQILFLYVSKEITKQTGMLPGSEIRTALIESKKLPHCVCRFGDRQFYITFKRAIGTLTPFQKLKLFISLVFNNPKMTKEEIEQYKQHDILETYLAELGNNYPTMKKALVDERDMYLAYQLQLASEIQVPTGEGAVYTRRLRESRNSLASVEQQLINCNHELDNFKKIKSNDNPIHHDEQIQKYELQLKNLKNQYNKAHQQVILDTEKLTSFSQQLNSDNYGPSVVVGIVGMGHMNGISKFFGHVTEEDVKEVLQIPEPTLQSIVLRKVVKYSFYSIVIYAFSRYVLPSNIKNSIVHLTVNSINLSKEFVNDKILVKKI